MFDYQVNWMGKEHSTTATVRVDPKNMHTIPTGKQNQLYNHRREVEKIIRQRLRLIKRDLDGGVSEDDEDVDYDEGDIAIMKLTNFIKSQRLREGKLFVSYVDGSSHEGVAAVRAYNHYTHTALLSLCETILSVDATAMIPTLPPETEFEVEFAEIEKLKKEEAVVMGERRGQQQHRQYDQNKGLNQDRVNEDSAAINKDHRVMRIRADIDALRMQYNDKAIQYSKHVMSFQFIRGTKLSEGFHAETAEYIPLLIEGRPDAKY